MKDDPLDPADYKSKAWKDRAMKFTQNCQDIADLTVIIGQYVNEDDLYVHYESILPPSNIIRCWHGTIPELDVEWEDKKRQGYTLREWGLNYEGRFYPDDERRLNIKITDQMPYDTVCYIDMSYIRKSMSSAEGDYTAVAFGQLSGSPRKGTAGKVLYPDLIVAGYLFANAVDMRAKIMHLIDRHNCRYIVYDASKDFHEEFVEWLNFSNFKGRVVAARSEKEKKETKIINNITWIQETDGLRYWHGSDKQFLSQVEMYTPSEPHDDAPDAVACLIRELRIGRDSRRGVLQNATVWSAKYRR